MAMSAGQFCAMRLQEGEDLKAWREFFGWRGSRCSHEALKILGLKVGIDGEMKCYEDGMHQKRKFGACKIPSNVQFF